MPLPELDYVTEQGRVSSANTPEVQLCSADGPDTDHHKVRSVKLRTAALATRPRTVVVESHVQQNQHATADVNDRHATNTSDPLMDSTKTSIHDV